jgi:hypothetical protein
MLDEAAKLNCGPVAPGSRRQASRVSESGGGAEGQEKEQSILGIPEAWDDLLNPRLDTAESPSH